MSESLRLPLGPELERGPEISVLLEGRRVTAYLGVCFDCLVVVDDEPNARACVTWVREGMRIARQDGLQAVPDART